MTQQEKIREELCGLAHYFMGRYFGKDISIKQFNDRIDATRTRLNELGVVLEVDNGRDLAGCCIARLEPLIDVKEAD